MRETETPTYEPLSEKHIDNLVALGYVLERIHWGLVARGYRITKNTIIPPSRVRMPLKSFFRSVDEYVIEEEYTSWLTYAIGEIDWSAMHADQIEEQEDAELYYDLSHI